jgi:phage terminase large subunit-like protein
MGIRTDLLVTEEIAESSDLRATPFEFEKAKRVETALSILEGEGKVRRRFLVPWRLRTIRKMWNLPPIRHNHDTTSQSPMFESKRWMTQSLH